MVITKLMGGLGNQMFQYAAGRSLAIKHRVPLLLDCFFLEENSQERDGFTPRSYELDIFQLKASKLTVSKRNQLFRPSFVQRLSQLFGINRFEFYKEQSAGFNKEWWSLEPPAYIEGYWQTERYFEEFAHEIRKDFTFHGPLGAHNQQIIDHIRQTCSVSIHFRRGDYAHSPATNSIHGLCSLSYYEQAVETIKQRFPDAYFFVFTDDPEWVRDNFTHNSDRMMLVAVNSGTNSWKDMLLMSSCRHHIIANSSFSWWAAWLNPSADKMVIAPANWFVSPEMNQQTSDLIPATWIRI